MLFLLHWHIVWFQYSSNKYPFVTIPTSALVNLALVFNLSWTEGDRLGRACPQDDGCHDSLDQLSKGQNNVKNPVGGDVNFSFFHNLCVVVCPVVMAKIIFCGVVEFSCRPTRRCPHSI